MSRADVVWHASTLDRPTRWDALKTRGGTLWFTGLSGSGKSTIAVELERQLVLAGVWAYRLDGDNLRTGLNNDLGFSDEDRTENLRRVTELAFLFADAGAICITSTISPLQRHRDAARKRHEDAGLTFVEVFVSTPVEVCRQRDPKGLYARADQGLIPEFTGVSAPYEVPTAPDVILAAHEISVPEACQRCLAVAADRNLIVAAIPRP